MRAYRTDLTRWSGVHVVGVTSTLTAYTGAITVTDLLEIAEQLTTVNEQTRKVNIQFQKQTNIISYTLNKIILF